LPSITLAQAGLKVVEVPIVFRERTTGESKVSGSLSRYPLGQYFTLYSKVFV
jgi:hypothetical protein